jgi:hypothetical protein
MFFLCYSLVHLDQRTMGTIAITWHLSSVNFSHFKLLLRNHWAIDLTIHTSLSPIRLGFATGFVNYKKGCTRLAPASDKVYQLLVHGWWFSLGIPASSTTKTGRHDITEILLKPVANPSRIGDRLV